MLIQNLEQIRLSFSIVLKKIVCVKHSEIKNLTRRKILKSSLRHDISFSAIQTVCQKFWGQKKIWPWKFFVSFQSFIFLPKIPVLFFLKQEKAKLKFTSRRSVVRSEIWDTHSSLEIRFVIKLLLRFFFQNFLMPTFFRLGVRKGVF